MSSGLLEINRWISVAPMMDWIGEGRKRLRYKNLQAAEMPRSLYVAATASFARGSKLSGWLAGERGDHALPTTLLPLSARSGRPLDGPELSESGPKSRARGAGCEGEPPDLFPWKLTVRAPMLASGGPGHRR